MKWLFRIITKIISFPSTFVFFFPKYYYENKNAKHYIFGKAIVALNHKKPLDKVLMMHVFWYRYTRTLVGETLYERNRFLRFMLFMLGSIKVSRLNYDLTFMKASLKVLKKGGLIEIYPEGKLPQNDEIQPFKTSSVYLSIQSGAPIIPVYQDGNYGLFKRTKVVIGEPMYFKSTSLNPSVEELQRQTLILEEKIQELKRLSLSR